MMTQTLETLLMNVLPITSMIVMGGLLLLQLFRFFRVPLDSNAGSLNPQPTPPGDSLPIRSLLPRVALLLLLSRALILLIAWIMGNLQQPASDIFSNPQATWVRWDANHYLGLAENWYVNEGDPRFHIVFYPLYPLAVRLLRPALLGSTLLSALLVSNACLFGCGWALYRLVEMQQGPSAASRALLYLMICPLSLFFSIPYSESMFLLLTLLSVLMARRRHMLWAIAFGALAAATRLLGLLCAVPVFYEFLCIAREHSAGDGKRLIRELLKGFALSCLIALGFLAYLWLNQAVTGDPLRFLTYQREHWSQTFGSLANSLRYTIDNAFETQDWGSRFGIWVPQLCAIVLVLIMLCRTALRIHPGDGAFALLYYYIALSPTWLLSGPRYLAGMYALYPMLAMVTRRKWQHTLMSALLLILSVYVVFMYAIAGSLF